MKSQKPICLFGLLGLIAVLPLAGQSRIQVTDGVLTIPTYEHSARETAPPLFGNSTVTGLYPFPTYVYPFKPDSPKPHQYRAIFIENEYLKMTYLPELGGRIFSLYDKLRGREVFYRNDVIKPAPYNPRNSWPQFGIELTGPHDVHMLTLHGEPFWAHQVIRHDDGSVSLAMSEFDPVYHMQVSFTATLHPGIAAMEISVFCYNRRDGRMPQMFWTNAAVPATEETRFLYPMSRTIGHTSAEVADWPVFNGIDYSWNRNNKNMLGVFGIDTYDNFGGAYHFGLDYGVFRYADRRVVQGMKLWTFGNGEGATNHERGYTDKAGPYVEIQSGRHVWDGYYEWVGPHKTEQWSEWWVPVSGIGGLTTLTRDAALNLEVKDHSVRIRLAATRILAGVKIVASAGGTEILNTRADLTPGKAFDTPVAVAEAGDIIVRVTDTSGRELLNYHRPGADPGRKEYTPFTKPLELPHKSLEQMSVEELVLAAESKLKELNAAAAERMLKLALGRDPGCSRAHLQLGIHYFTGGRYGNAAAELEKAIARDPYLGEAYYYLAMSQFALGQDQLAERNLYYIWPDSAYFGEREYHLGRLDFLNGNLAAAVSHLHRAVMANGYDLSARQLLAATLRAKGDVRNALGQLAEIQRVDPTDRSVLIERYFLTGNPEARTELLRRMGGQTQEAIDLAIPYEKLRRWKEAIQILEWAEAARQDPWGTTPEFYYTLAWCLSRNGEGARATEYLKKARTAAGSVDRFPYREESEAPLEAAVQADIKDAVARFNLGCLLYYRERPAEAIRQWEAAVEANPRDFQSRRALGLAYAEQGYKIEKAAQQLEAATELNPAHIRTLNDLSAIYARAGRFDEQLAVLQKALARSPNDDDLAAGVLTAYLIRGQYGEAEKLIAAHSFAPRHRIYDLRDKYREMRYAMGAAAFHRGRYAEALQFFESALKPPVSLGIDTFQSEGTPRLQYYLGRTLESLGREADARAAYRKAVDGIGNLSGDRDSWNAENFFMVYALEELGRAGQARELLKHFADFAGTEIDSAEAQHRAAARYLLGLVRKHDGQAEAARKLMEEAVEAEPDLLPARLELSGDAIGPAAETTSGGIRFEAYSGELAYGLAVVPPWPNGGRLVVNFPEHLEAGAKGDVSILRYYEKQPKVRWQVSPDGRAAVLETESSFTPGVFVHARGQVVGNDRIEFVFTIENKSARPLTDITPLYCHHYAGLTGFPQRAEAAPAPFVNFDHIYAVIAGKVVRVSALATPKPDARVRGANVTGCDQAESPFVKSYGGLLAQRVDAAISALTSLDDRRKIILAWTPGKSFLSNAEIPCIHADPFYGTIEPGKSATARGVLIMTEGDLEPIMLGLFSRGEGKALHP